VAEGDFAHAAHRAVWRAAVALRGEGKPVDPATVYQELTARGWVRELDAGNPASWLADLVLLERTGVSVTYHAGRGREASTFRKPRHAAGVILRDATDPTAPADELVAQAEQCILDVAAGAVGAEAVPDASALMTEVLQGIDDRAAGASVGLATGFAELDQYI